MKQEIYYKTVLIYEGIPYFLATTPKGYHGEVCKECDLRWLCMGIGEEYRFRDLCSPDDGEAPYRFVVDTESDDKTLIDIIMSQQVFNGMPKESKLIQGPEDK